ncbi:MAG TPA: exonuclease SbcCD subunit D [Candidatus Stackebrandtia faecavium]|nr:exonuclease SbcCD subunit D [Candidatus Stackebrandtia faecavium]
MRILHTSDWHIGATLKGQSRMAEQKAVFAELVELAQAQQPDLVIVAGDLFETPTPGAAAQKLLVQTLSDLRETGADVVAVAGNHDHGRAIDALRTWANAAGITLRGTIGRAEDHLIRGTTRDGEDWRCAALPFVSQRYAVRATELFSLSPAETGQSYADHIRRLVAALSTSFSAESVNLITGHLTVVGGKIGGGEREVHTVADYAVPATIFPASTHYVALGHIHRQQQIPGGCPIRYSGAPFAVDFGEETYTPGAVLVDVTRNTPARARHVPIEAAVPLRTLRGTLEQLHDADNDERGWLRVFVDEKPRAGLREEVQELFPNALSIQIDPGRMPNRKQRPLTTRIGRSPHELFRDFLSERGHDDPAVLALFDELHDQVASAPSEDKESA